MNGMDFPFASSGMRDLSTVGSWGDSEFYKRRLVWLLILLMFTILIKTSTMRLHLTVVMVLLFWSR